MMAAVASCAWAQDVPAVAAQPAPGLREVFPHVRVDAAARVVEIDGVVPIDCHDPETPDVFLEVVACTSGTKEHEALVMTSARPSHVHAALLAIGLEPGKPGSWDWDGVTVRSQAPHGPPVRVSVAYEDEEGMTIEADVREWIVGVEDGTRFGAGEDDGWVFAGSRMVTRGEREVYDADGTGLVVGLTTFGSEVVAWRTVISPEEDVAAPVWIANRDLVPKYKTGVRVRIEGVKGKQDSQKPEAPPD